VSAGPRIHRRRPPQGRRVPSQVLHMVWTPGAMTGGPCEAALPHLEAVRTATSSDVADEQLRLAREAGARPDHLRSAYQAFRAQYRTEMTRG
jgi:hypothetical protein